MKHPEILIESISTLLHSWGGDTPPEAIWAFNEIVDWVNSEYGFEIDQLDEGAIYDSDPIGDPWKPEADLKAALLSLKED